MTTPLTITFMGTPAFAVPALDAILQAGHKVTAVYTQPPRPTGRGQKETPSPVHTLALGHGIPVYTLIGLKSPEVQEQFRLHQADVAVVAAYGLLLPKLILDAYSHGCLNIHPSLLPRWRGAAPIQRAIMAGDTESGVCIMQMDEGLDTGDILLEERISLPSDITAGEWHDKAAKIGAHLLIEALTRLKDGSLKSWKQSEQGITYAKKITKEEARIDWNNSAPDVHNQIRGMAPFPGAYFIHRSENIKILRSQIVEKNSGNDTPGIMLDDSFTIACAIGTIRPLIVQRPGKKPMEAQEMLRGFPIHAGEKLE